MLHCKGQSLRYPSGRGNPLCFFVELYVGEGSEREQCQLLSSRPAFSHFLCYPQENLILLVLLPGGWVCVCSRTQLGLSNELSCDVGTFSCYLNSYRFFQSEVLRLYFPTLEPWVAWSVSLPRCSSWFICTQMWDRPVHHPLPHLVFQPLPWHAVLSTPAACLHLFYWSRWMFLL